MKTYRIITTLLSAAVFVSCNYLDFDETNGLNTHDNIYKYFDNTKQMLTNVYSYIPQDFGAVEEAMRDCASDDAEFGNTGGGVQDFNNGNWSALKTLYNGIRAANEFIASIADVDFSRFEYGPSYPNWERQLRYFPYEARMLRAFYFFELARRYGDIAMPTRMLTIEEANTIGKTSFDEVIGFIVAECDACAADGNLPNTYVGEPGNETGRITRGFALALKSKALLYAASELHNPSMDVERWKRSAKAALDLIETGLYSLDPADKSNNITSPEVVLLRMNSDDNTFELRNFPIRFTEGRRTTAATGTFPTQELVDAFQTKNGYPVTLGVNGWQCDDPQFNAQTPYANRDLRFARTILANGSQFKGCLDTLQQSGIVPRLRDKVERARLHTLHGKLYTSPRRHQDNRYIGAEYFHLFQQSQPLFSRCGKGEVHVHQNEGRCLGTHHIHCFARSGNSLRFISCTFQHKTEGRTYGTIIVDYQYHKVSLFYGLQK